MATADTLLFENVGLHYAVHCSKFNTAILSIPVLQLNACFQ